MTNYPISAYGNVNPNEGYPANGNTSAWGGYEWPNCPPASLQGTTDYTTKYGQRLRVTVRKELVELLTLKFKIADKFNYKIWANNDGENWGPWGGECRPISGTNNPSGHSKFLSDDENAPYNPYSYTWQCDMPPDYVAACESIGFYWGGRYRNQKYDPMHYGFCYKPSDVARFVEKAKSILGEDDDMPLSDADKSWIVDAINDGLRKALTLDKNIVGPDKASTPNDIPYSFETGIERLIRLTSGTYVGEKGTPH